MMRHYNLKSLAIESGLSYNNFVREYKSLLSDYEISREFGVYRNRKFTKKQLRILVENISYIEHIKID